MPLVMFGVKEQSNLRWLVVQRVRRSSPRSADAPLAGGLSSQCKITNYALDLLGHNMLNGQRQNDYTAIAPTSLLVAGVRALAPGCGQSTTESEIGILSNSISNAVVFKSANGCVCDAKDEAFMTMRVIKAPLGALD
jgi:hypothetical protein